MIGRAAGEKGRRLASLPAFADSIRCHAQEKYLSKTPAPCAEAAASSYPETLCLSELIPLPKCEVLLLSLRQPCSRN